MAPKRSKSRFTDLVKFVPEEVEEAYVPRKSNSGIQTQMLSEAQAPVRPAYEEKSYQSVVEEPVEEEISAAELTEDFEDEIPEIPEISAEQMEEIADEETYYEDETYEEDEEIDVRDLTEEVDIDEETETEEETVEPSGVENMGRPVQSFGQQSEAKREFNSEIKNITETIILGNTTIKGDIITDTGIQVYGAVLGNIESGGRVQVVGKVEGNITGKTVYVTNTAQNGNIEAETEVHIKEGCTITGDVVAERVFLKGTIIGNIQASGQVDFESGSEINGNVSAHSFNIKPGAKINGSISTN